MVDRGRLAAIPKGVKSHGDVVSWGTRSVKRYFRDVILIAGWKLH